MNYYITIKALYRYPISLDFPMKSFISTCFPPFFGLKALHFFHPKNMSSLNVPARLVLLLDKTFQTRKNTVYRVTSRAAGADAGGGQDQGGTCQRPGRSREAERFFGMSQGIERNRRDHRVEFSALNHLIVI